MEIIQNVSLISINATLLVQLGSFLIFVVIFDRIMIRPLRRVMSERTKYLQKVREDITTANVKYKEIGRQIKTQEAAARRAAFKIRDGIQSAGEKQAAEVLADTRNQISTMKSEAQQETKAKIAAARRQIEDEAESISEKMIVSLLGRRNAS